MAVGLISDEEFQRLSTEFVHLSHNIDDGWELLKVKEKTYLSKRVLRKLESVSCEPVADREGLDEADLEDDEGCLSGMGDNSSLMFHYIVVYSESYSVPVLCCNVHRQDGRPLTLEEVWSLVPVHYQDRLKGDPWTFLTQQQLPGGLVECRGTCVTSGGATGVRSAAKIDGQAVVIQTGRAVIPGR